MSKIVIATPLYPPQIGGPAKYAEVIHLELERRGYTAPVVAYGALERTLPSGVRHFVYFLRLLPKLWGATCVVALDTWSVGLPALYAARLMRKKYLVRIGGDFLWEQYVERTGELVKLSQFYTSLRRLILKEKLVAWGARRIAQRADALLFNSAWLRDIWLSQYQFNSARSYIVENVFPPRKPAQNPSKKTFVAAGRPIKLKQEALLKKIFSEIAKSHPEVFLDLSPLPPEEHQKRIASSYAVLLASVSDVSPNTIIDAVTYGKPFICSSDTGIRERLEGTGIFVDTQNEMVLTETIESLLDSKTYEHIQKQVQAFSFVRMWEEVADDILNIIKAL